MSRISIDLVYSPENSIIEYSETAGSDLMSYLNEICLIYSLKIVRLVPVGPGGGHSVFTFEGSYENVLSLAKVIYESEDPNFINSQIK